MCQFDVDAILIKVCSIGLKEKHLGKNLKAMQAELLKLNGLYGVHVCGEGGEYETLTLDCPAFIKKLELYQETNLTLEQREVSIRHLTQLLNKLEEFRY